MGIFDDTGRLDLAVVLSSCQHGKDGESCPRCAIDAVERDNRGLAARPRRGYFEDLADVASIRLHWTPEVK